RRLWSGSAGNHADSARQKSPSEETSFHSYPYFGVRWNRTLVWRTHDRRAGRTDKTAHPTGGRRPLERHRHVVGAGRRTGLACLVRVTAAAFFIDVVRVRPVIRR